VIDAAGEMVEARFLRIVGIIYIIIDYRTHMMDNSCLYQIVAAIAVLTDIGTS
jgi:hypothetical protein